MSRANHDFDMQYRGIEVGCRRVRSRERWMAFVSGFQQIDLQCPGLGGSKRKDALHALVQSGYRVLHSTLFHNETPSWDEVETQLHELRRREEACPLTWWERIRRRVKDAFTPEVERI